MPLQLLGGHMLPLLLFAFAAAREWSNCILVKEGVFHPIYFVIRFSHKDPQVHAGIISRISLTGKHCLSQTLTSA